MAELFGWLTVAAVLAVTGVIVSLMNKPVDPSQTEEEQSRTGKHTLILLMLALVAWWLLTQPSRSQEPDRADRGSDYDLPLVRSR